MIKNHIKHIKLTRKMSEDLKEIAEALDFKETDLIRYLLNNSISRLKSAKIKAGGYDNLEFGLKEPL